MKKYLYFFIFISLFLFLKGDNETITSSPSQIFVGTQIQFGISGIDMSTSPNPTWNFNDGTPTQSGVSVSHSFNEPGTYNVVCNWAEGGQTKEINKSITVNDNRNVSYQGSNFIVSMNVQFNTSNFVHNKLKWDFGDGTVQDNAPHNKKHKYQNPGNFTVKVYDFNGNTSTIITCNINIGQDNRSVEFTPGSPVAKQKVAFSAKNFGSSNLRWDFGDGVQNGSTNIEHTYNNPGNYTVKVKDLSDDSLNEITKTINIVPDNRSITVKTSPPKAKQTVEFQANSFSSSNLKWNFGVGPEKNGGQNMVHIYNQQGNYTVKLKDLSQPTLPDVTANINVQPDNRMLNTNPMNPSLYQEITFNAMNFPGGNLEWDFGDNTRLNGGNTMKHLFSRMGRFVVKVKTTGTNNSPVEKAININRDMRRIEVIPSSTVVGQMVSIRLLNSDKNQVDWKIGRETIKLNSQKNIQHNFFDPGRFEIICQIKNQTPVRGMINVRENRNISVSPQYIFEGSKLTITTRNFNSQRLKWDMGDGTVRHAGKNFQYIYKRPGNFMVKVYDFEGKSKIPLMKRLNILRENRSIEFKSRIVFKDSDLEIEGKNFRGHSIQWSFGDGASKMGSRKIKHKYRRTGNFNVSAVDFGGKDTKKIVKNVQVQVDNRKISLPSEIIEGEGYDMAIQNISGGNFEWKFSDGDNKSGVSLQSKKFRSPGMRTITIIDRSGKYPPFEKQISVKPDTRALKISSKFGLPDESFSCNAINFKGSSVKWDFGDGTVVERGQKNMKHKYNRTGKYKIMAIDFGGKSKKPFSEEITVSQLTPNFDVERLEIAFNDGKYYKVIPKKSMPPSYYVKIKVKGRGIIVGEWILDGMSMGTFNILLRENQLAVLKGNKVVKLPIIDLGIHDFTFNFKNYELTKKIPIIRYFVSEGGAIKIKYPLQSAKIPGDRAIKLKWFLKKKKANYEITISEIPFQFLRSTQIKWEKVGEMREYSIDLSKYKPRTWIYWQVREVDSSGKVLTTSEISLFKIEKTN